MWRSKSLLKSKQKNLYGHSKVFSFLLHHLHRVYFISPSENWFIFGMDILGQEKTEFEVFFLTNRQLLSCSNPCIKKFGMSNMLDVKL